MSDLAEQDGGADGRRRSASTKTGVGGTPTLKQKMFGKRSSGTFARKGDEDATAVEGGGSGSGSAPPTPEAVASPGMSRKTGAATTGRAGGFSMFKSRKSVATTSSPDSPSLGRRVDKKFAAFLRPNERTSESDLERDEALLFVSSEAGLPTVQLVPADRSASSGSVAMAAPGAAAGGAAIVAGAAALGMPGGPSGVGGGSGGTGSAGMASPATAQVRAPASASPKVAPRNNKKPFLPGLLRSRVKQDNSPFSRQRDGNVVVSFATHFEGTPVVSGTLQEEPEPSGLQVLQHPQQQLAQQASPPLAAAAAAAAAGAAGAASASQPAQDDLLVPDAMVRLEGIPGRLVRQVYSCENMLGVVSQTGDLYVAASSLLHHSASGQPPPEPGQQPPPVAHGQFRLLRVKGMGPLRRVALGDYHSGAITEDGRIFTWGMNVNDPRYLTQEPAGGKSISSVLSGQLGHGFLMYRFAPPMVINGVPGVPVDVSVGSSHTVVLTDAGVFTCGNPMAVGRPDTFVFDVLMPVPGLNDVVVSAVACGADHTLAVARATGSVYSWGLNDHGQLGQPRACKYAAEPMLVEKSKNVSSVHAGPQHSVCVALMGYVVVWGSNLHGELGIGSEEGRIFEPTGAPLAEEHTVILASCSRSSTFLVTDTGEVFQAGLVVGGATRSFTRVPIEAKYVGGVAAGASHVVYLIDQALTNIMALLMEPRSSSSEAFVRKLLRLCQVAVDNDSADLINGVQSRVNRLASEGGGASGVPRVAVNQTVLACVMQPGVGKRTATHIVRVANLNGYRIECNGWWSLQQDYHEALQIHFTPQTFVLDEGESTFLRVEVVLLDESQATGSLQTLCQLSARRLRKNKASAKSGSSGGAFASHFFFLDVGFSDQGRARDPLLVQHLVDAMSTYVPRLILRELHADPAPPSGPREATFPGAVLFIDVSGFTALNARLSKLGPAGPEQVSTHLNRYFGQLIDAVHLHGGDVLKFAGDALICLFGTPDGREPLAALVLRAVRCGCLIQRDLAEYDSQQGFRLRIHIGVGSGDIHLLYLGGVNGHYEHIVMGDAMLQLETAVEVSKAGEVAVSADAHALIADRVQSEARGPENFLVTGVLEDGPPSSPPSQQPEAAVAATVEMEAGLRCFLPTSVLARIDALHMSWLAELRRVTVIFVNLTSLAYQRGQRVEVAAINAVLCSMQDIVFRYEGMVRQFIVDDKGTVLIAAFGVPPFGHEDDPVRGVRAAWEIHHKLREASVVSRIGVTTGKVFCGSVGSSKRQEYAMVGDIVNLAARLMGVAKRLGLGVVVDETTRESAEDLVVFQELEPVLVKGRTEPVAIAQPVELKQASAADQHHQNLPGGVAADGRSAGGVAAAQPSMPELPMVGRKAEMGLLQLQVAKLQAQRKTARDARGSTKTFLLSGLAGMGKTRIINELARLCRRQNVEYYIGQCDALEKTKPFFVFQTILEQLINLELWKRRRNQQQEESGAAPAASKSSVAASFGIEDDSNWAEYLPLLNNVLPLGLPDNEMCSKLDVKNRHMLTVSFMAYLIQARAQEKPVVLIVEDLQWIDASSMQLLAAVAAETSANTKGILIVLSQRAPPQHPHYKQLLQLTGVEELKLVPLGDAECRQIACGVLGVEVGSWPQQLDKALQKAHGNPLFAMEIAMGLRESGLVDVSDGRLVLLSNSAAPSDGMEIPETVEGMIGSRIDQLPSGPQLLLKVASVIGMEFTTSMLAAIFPIASQRNTIAASLKELVEVGLLERSGSTSHTFRFKNDTVRDVTYMRMLFTQRQQLHEKIALYYEEQKRGGGGGGSESRHMLKALAHHWRMALLNTTGTNDTSGGHNLTPIVTYIMAAASLLQEEENVELATQYLDDAEKVVALMPETNPFEAEEKHMLKAAVQQKRATFVVQ